MIHCGRLEARTVPSLDSMLTVYRADTANASPFLLNAIGSVYYQAYTYEGYNRALMYFQKALDRAKKLHDEKMETTSYKMIAGVYDASNMSLDTAALYYQKGLEYDLRSNDSAMIIQSYRNVLVINDKLYNEERKLYYADKLYNYLKNYRGEQYELFRNQLSIYYSQKHILGKAAELFTPIDVEKTAQADIEGFRNYYYAGHFFYQAQKRYADAIALLNGVLPYTRVAIDSMSIYKFLSEHYVALGDYKNAFLTLNKCMVLSSAYEQMTNRNKIAETATFYANEQKEKERIAFKEKSETETKIKNYALLVMFLLALVVIIIALFAKQTSNRNKLLKVQKEEVERLNRLNQKIFSVISHDLNAPLMSMNLLLNVLKSRNYQKEEIDEYAADISNQITQSKMILENLLSWARTELNMQQNYAGREIRSNVHAIVAEVTQQLQSAATDKKITVVNTIPENSYVIVLPDILKIVFRNLLSNAIKFSYPNAVVEMGMNANGHTFFIKDNGVGMDAKRLERLFKGAVGNKLGTSNETGFGLGLYMTNELVQKSGGTIRVESKPGEGTSFILALPIDENT